MLTISASITSSLSSTLLNRSLNPRFIFRYTPPVSPITVLVDPRTVIKRSFPVIQGNAGIRASSSMSNNGGDAGKRVVHFNLSPTSAIKIQKGDITRWSIDGSSDAIVNPANERMLGGGGADGAIHQAAGPELRTACYDVPEVRPGVRCPTGEARITPGFKLPASHVIHTVGPIYDANSNVAALLSNAYRNSLRVAREKNIQYVAFPAISCGVFGYPFEEAATVAISTIKEHCNDIKEAHFVLFSDDIYNVWLKKAEELLPN
ncbi:hypothetical protein OSB04_017489 [Centaurea solstitialis]|uniref:Macro domain-containing protein n=1 Tax=Centaurea solstitialis TaxID=347529 RepID=A0AA38WKR9_9ASTR|nr:hypothetical protein OSB04_017489 [Centaurea solstitialis]